MCYTDVARVTQETDVISVSNRCQSYNEYLQTVCAPRIHLALSRHHCNCCHWRTLFKNVFIIKRGMVRCLGDDVKSVQTSA